MNKPFEHRERSENIPPSVRVIDETSPLQPFVQHGELDATLSFSESAFPSFTVYSDEGFAHNEKRQREAGAAIATVFDISHRGAVLDVGWGSNSFVSDEIHARTGVQAALINYEGSPTRDNPPIRQKPVADGLTAYTGDIHDISSAHSELKNAKFGAIMFNGSWAAGGENHTIQELADLVTQGRGVFSDSKSFRPMINQRLAETIASLKEHLQPNGLFYVASSRYAFHGAGYMFSRMPEEKLQFLDFIAKTIPFHPKKVTLIGVSDTKILRMLERNRSHPEAKNLEERNALLNLAIHNAGRERPNEIIEPLLRIGQFEDLLVFTEDQGLRTKFLAQHPELRQLFEKELEDVHKTQDSIIAQLTDGVDALPEQFTRNYPFTGEDVGRIKGATRSFIPASIARIDAVGIEF